MGDWAAISRGVAITGVGMTPLSTSSGKSEAVLAADAVLAALGDAGLTLGDVDGLVTYGVDTNDPLELAVSLGLRDLRWYSTTPYGGGGTCATIQDAVLAVGAGLADVVVVYRAANVRSGVRFGRPPDHLVARPMRWLLPFGITTAAHGLSPWFHRYLHEFGLNNADLAPVCVTARDYASTNPAAHFFDRPLTIAEHQASPWVAEPVLRVADCCLESDGGAAVVVTRRERVNESSRAVAVTAAVRAMAAAGPLMQNYGQDRTELPDATLAANQIWKQSGIGPDDISVAILYEGFSPIVLMALETFGFCKPGEAAHFVAEGGIARSGPLPVNPNGGQLGEGYLHGFNGIVEAVRQVRGTAANQVADVEHVLVTGGLFLPTSALILSTLP